MKNTAYKNSLLYRWTTDFVGSKKVLWLIILITLIGGLIYTFNLVESVAILLILGALLPVLLIFCLYGAILHLNIPYADTKIFELYRNRRLNIVMRLVDCIIVLGLAALIYFNILNYLFFRLIQTTIIPILLLLMLRTLYLADKHELPPDNNL